MDVILVIEVHVYARRHEQARRVLLSRFDDGDA